MGGGERGRRGGRRRTRARRAGARRRRRRRAGRRTRGTGGGNSLIAVLLCGSCMAGNYSDTESDVGDETIVPPNTEGQHQAVMTSQDQPTGTHAMVHGRKDETLPPGYIAVNEGNDQSQPPSYNTIFGNQTNPAEAHPPTVPSDNVLYA